VVLHKTEAQRAALERAFWDVSTPSHPRYGQHLSQRDVTDLVAPPESIVQRVVVWLRGHGATAVKIGAHRDLLSVEIPARAAETLFATEVHHYAHATLDVPSICRSAAPYFVPSEMSDLIALVGNLRHFPDMSHMQLQFQRDSQPQSQDAAEADGEVSDSAWPSSDCTSKCASGLFGKRITPGVLSAAYNLGDRPNATGAKGDIAVAEFTQVFYNQKDLTRFGEDCGLGNITVDHYFGPPNEPKQCEVSIIIRPNLCKEAHLDIETIKGLVGNIPLSNFYTKEYDLLGWAQQLGNLSDTALPLVHSVSYGNDETQQSSTAYMMAFNVEAQKLGARGATILFASGDNGVSGRRGSGKRFHPGFPATSPYVTTVGGTDFTTKSVVGSETAWWGSGGGFSDTFAIPDFQADAVSAYKKLAADSLPDASKWNQTGAGFPDVAALAGNKNQYCITLNGGETGAYGTSAATPVWGAVVARLNEQRLASGKPPMGFMNPFLYSNPGAMNDVVTGDNSGRNGQKGGFPAVKGWDAATGLGTPDFEKLSAAAMA
jgi:tripeptidyl-peptidase-1